jgi:hypothetical protein
VYRSESNIEVAARKRRVRNSNVEEASRRLANRRRKQA